LNFGLVYRFYQFLLKTKPKFKLIAERRVTHHSTRAFTLITKIYMVAAKCLKISPIWGLTRNLGPDTKIQNLSEMSREIHHSTRLGLLIINMQTARQMVELFKINGRKTENTAILCTYFDRKTRKCVLFFG